MSHEVRLIRGLVAEASAALLARPPVNVPVKRLEFVNPPLQFFQRRSRTFDVVRRRFLAISLRRLFSGSEGPNAATVLSYAKSSLVTTRKATKGGQRIRYGVDAGGPFKRTTSWQRVSSRKRESTNRISFEEWIFSSKDPEETYRSICILIVEGAAIILGADVVRRIIESEQ